MSVRLTELETSLYIRSNIPALFSWASVVQVTSVIIHLEAHYTAREGLVRANSLSKPGCG